MNPGIRIKTVAQMISYRSVADIGTDHGKLPIYLSLNGSFTKLVASDINYGPLEFCKNNVKNFSLEDVIEIRQSDGLKNYLPFECETFVICGMGGELITKILSESKKNAQSAKEIILQPMTNIEKLRFFLADEGYEITEEKLCREKGKIYNVIKCKFSEKYEISFKDAFVPKKLFADALFTEFLEKKLNSVNNMLKGDESNPDLLEVKEYIENILKG